MHALLDFVGDIYEAAYQPNRWDSVMEQLCQLFEARSSAIFMHDYESNIREMVGSHGFPNAVVMAYRLGLSKYDYTFQLQQNIPPGKAMQLFDSRQLKTSHPFYYRLLLKPNDIGFMGAMGIYNDEEWHIGIGLHRSFNAEPFSAEQLHQLQLLYPHFKRALRIYKEFQTLHLQRKTLHNVLGHFISGVIVTKADGTIEYCNPVAQALLQQHQGLRISNNKLQAHILSEHQQLHKIIQHLCQSDPHDVTTRTMSLNLHHPAQQHALTIMLTALHDPQQQPGIVALYIADPAATCHLSPETLHTLYRLTPAEAQVAIALANGLSVVQICESHGVTIETVRSQLKNIYSKMGVHKQQDVVRLLLSGIPQVS